MQGAPLGPLQAPCTRDHGAISPWDAQCAWLQGPAEWARPASGQWQEKGGWGGTRWAFWSIQRPTDQLPTAVKSPPSPPGPPSPLAKVSASSVPPSGLSPQCRLRQP